MGNVIRLTTNNLENASYDENGEALHEYYTNEKSGVSVGLWACEKCDFPLEPFTGDEFIVMLSGQAELTDDTGKTHILGAGEVSYIANGTPLNWKQNGPVLKIYFNHHTEESKVGPNPHFAKLSADTELEEMTTTDPFVIKGSKPLQKNKTVFTSANENVFIGNWSTESMESEMLPFPSHEFVQIIEGEITITEEDGSAQTFKAGEAFYVPQGTVCSWKIDGYVKKFYTIFVE